MSVKKKTLLQTCHRLMEEFKLEAVRMHLDHARRKTLGTQPYLIWPLLLSWYLLNEFRIRRLVW